LERRADDDELTIRRRIAVYREEASPLERFYVERDLLYQVDAEGTPDEVIDRAMKVLEGLE
jgi:adenylate kinase